ncbi:MAG: FUSC family protein [Microbacterium sp.]
MTEAEPLPERVRAEARAVGVSLVTLRPVGARRWPLALQAALAMAVPIVAMAVAGHEDLALLGAPGAFAVVYGGWLRPRERARFAPIVAVALVLTAAVGAFSAVGGHAAVLAGIAVIAIGSTALAGWLSIGPPGPVFIVLVFGLSARIVAARDGAQAVTPAVYLSAVAVTAVFACLVVAAPLLSRRYRRERPRPLRELFLRRWGPAARAMTLRAGIVAVIGVAIAAIVDPDRAYWIVSAGVAVAGMPIGRRAAATRSIHRTVGTVVGAGIYLALAFIPFAVWMLGVLFGAMQFLIELVIMRNYAFALAVITPLVLLLIGASTGETESVEIALERVLDTFVGAALGAATAVFVRLRAG